MDKEQKKTIDNYFTYIIILITICIVTSLCNSIYTIRLIKQNSIHPIHGNYYPKIDSKGRKCSPFDDCK